MFLSFFSPISFLPILLFSHHHHLLTLFLPFFRFFSGYSCVLCLRESIVPKIVKEADKLVSEFSVQDLADLLSDVEFANYLENSVKHYLANNRNFVICPNTKCKCPIEVEMHSWATKSETAAMLASVRLSIYLPLSLSLFFSPFFSFLFFLPF
jgi:hypothetical protein